MQPEFFNAEEQLVSRNALPVPAFLERAGMVVLANAAAHQLLSIPPDGWTARPVQDLFLGVDLTALSHSGSLALMAARDGRMVDVTLFRGPSLSQEEDAILLAIPAAVATESSLLENVLASLPDAVVLLRQGRIAYTNPAFTRVFGFTAQESMGADLHARIVPETRQHELRILEQGIEINGYASIETVRLNSQGELIDVSLVAAPILAGEARLGLLLTYRDIRERKRIEARLQHDAMHDTLTGLPNRALFLDRLRQAFSRRARRQDHSCGVLFVDLDRFKEINDSLGHAAGDALLAAVAKRLSNAIRPQDTAARMGGDEFALLIESINSSEDLEVVATRVVRELSRPFDILTHALQVGASVGAAIVGPDHTAPEMLLRDADFAMYRAKQEGGARFELFDKELKTEAVVQQERERELRQILDKREFELWFQPIFHLPTGKLEGFESLLRWRREDGVVDSLRDLLPLVEESGLAFGLGRESFDAACRQLRQWAGSEPEKDLTLTVNLSARQFHHPDILAQIKRALAVSGADATHLLVEIQENTLNSDPKAAANILRQMAAAGLRIAVDNFGSGLCSLAPLVQLPIDVIKLAPSLTAAVAFSGRPLAVLESVLHLGQSMGVQVIAQGIEAAAQREALLALGCEFGQGLYLSDVLDPARARQLAVLGRWTPPSAV